MNQKNKSKDQEALDAIGVDKQLPAEHKKETLKSLDALMTLGEIVNLFTDKQVRTNVSLLQRAENAKKDSTKDASL